ncbi:MAG TPA: carboxymuconolactone decarboxylase family protein [Gemmatimonadaceae bacterium]|nr:carboxymuconolactone decarboxylase family protein [Gemmatimonadaceae bacterium]
MRALDDETAALVRLAVTIAVGDEGALREGVARAAASAADPVHVEEVILQSYLFVGFPRALNAMRAWRKATGRAAPARDEDAAGASPAGRRVRGELTCATVYGRLYDRLRVNIRELHPALDDWMIEEGYGRVLGRGALALRARELCVAAVCAATEQDRQLHSHLHGALHAGASAAEVSAALAIAGERLGPDSRDRIAHLWARVRAVA